MAITINGTGTITGISAGGLPSATVTQATLATPVAGTGPAFSAYLGSNQSISTGVFTKLQANTEEFDTASCFNNTGSTVGSIPAYAFLPNVAGYYQCDGRLESNINGTNTFITIYKNGSEFKRGEAKVFSFNAGTGSNIFTLIYLNGTTDYIEFYGYLIGTSPVIVSGAVNTYVQAVLVRSA
jgi:hypothetical protein